MLHARTVRGREGDLEQLYESLIARCRGLAEALDGAPRITPVHSAANFSYRTDPAIGDRFVCVGDAIAFVDPIFSSGVYIATQSAELSSAGDPHGVPGEPLRGPPLPRLRAPIHNGHAALPALHPALLRSRRSSRCSSSRASSRAWWTSVTGVLAGGAFLRRTLRMRVSLELFFTVVRDQPLGAPPPGPEHGIPLRMVALRRLLPRGYLFTVLGIAVGVAGLVALGAMAERITRFIDGGDRFVLGQISVAGEGMGMGTGFTAGGLLRASKIDQIGRVPGVAAVQGQVMLPLNPTTSQFLTLTQELILGHGSGGAHVQSGVPRAPGTRRALPSAGRSRGGGGRRRLRGLARAGERAGRSTWRPAGRSRWWACSTRP